MRSFLRLSFFIVACLPFVSCVKDEAAEGAFNAKARTSKTKDVKLVPFKGNFLSTPNDVTLTFCEDPVAGVSLPVIQVNAVEGNATHLGILDRDQSPLFVVDCSFNGETQIITVTLDMTFKNKKGDGMRILGQSNISTAGPASGSYEIIEGYGKFLGAAGWANTTGFFNPDTGSAKFSVDGKVTQPNRE